MATTTSNANLIVRPRPALASLTAYRVPRVTTAGPVDLHLDANEGIASPLDPADVLADGAERMRRYPSRVGLETALAARLGVAPDQVIVTAGGDDAIDRCCRVMLEPGRNLVLPVPTFEMIERSARLMGAAIRDVTWFGGSFPADEVIDLIDDDTALVSVVSPNNPTGAVATADDLRRLSVAAAGAGALLMVDLAYEEFADESLTDAALTLPNAVIVRTFSKAFGLAGMRVGYAVGPAAVIGWLRAAGSPYPTSGLSLAAAEQCLAMMERTAPYLARVRQEREALRSLLGNRGVRTLPSQANFVLAQFDDALAVQARLAERGIAVRAYPGVPRLERWLRITCPGRETELHRLCGALNEIL